MTQLKKVTNDWSSFPSLLTDIMDVDRFFGSDQFFRKMNKMPAANIKEQNNHYEIELAVPGMKKEDIKIELSNNILTISAQHKNEKTEEKDNYTRREFSYNSFSRSFDVPTSVNAEEVNAQYKDGLLLLTLPKKQEAIVNNKKEIKVS